MENKNPVATCFKIIKFIDADYGIKYLIAHNNDGFDKIIIPYS